MRLCLNVFCVTVTIAASVRDGWLIVIAWKVRRVICTSLLGWFPVVLSWISGRDGQKQDRQIRYSEGRLLIYNLKMYVTVL